MIVTVTTTVTFSIPTETDDAVQFVKEHDMTEWREITDSGYVSYSKKMAVVKGEIRTARAQDRSLENAVN